MGDRRISAYHGPAQRYPQTGVDQTRSGTVSQPLSADQSSALLARALAKRRRLLQQSPRQFFCGIASSVSLRSRPSRLARQFDSARNSKNLKLVGRDRRARSARRARALFLFALTDKISTWRRLESKDREKVMEPIASHENWRNCFCEVAPGLLLFARQWVQSAADAEDIVQEAFVKFWRRNHNIHNRALLYSAVRSIALDFIRRDKRRARREATVFAETEPSIEPQFELENDTQSALAAAVDSLPHDQREVLVLKIWNDLTFSEIAGALRISQNTAASRYRYALSNLKKSFQPQ